MSASSASAAARQPRLGAGGGAPASESEEDDDDDDDDIRAVDLNYEYTFNSTRGDGGDSDEEGDEVGDHTAAAFDRAAELAQTVVDQDDVEEAGVEGVPADPNENLKIPQPPADWKPPDRREDRNEPEFSSVDNPGGWPEYTFRPVFKKDPSIKSGPLKGKPVYSHHSLPTGCIPVPEDDDHHRSINGWDFFYRGDYYREFYDHYAPEAFKYKSERGDPNPERFDGSLDTQKLKLLGLTPKRMDRGDALFFLNLVLPIGDPKKGPLTEDDRMSFFQKVQGFTNQYAFDPENNISGSYGHRFKAVDVEEIVHFFGVVVRDGALGGSDGDIHCRWKTPGCIDDDIVNSITLQRWLEIKRVIKLNNNNSPRPKRGEPRYEPAYKYDYIWKTLVHNTNFVSLWAALLITGDETTWGFGGFGEPGIVLRRKGKPGISKGGQTVLLSDYNWVRPRAYMHRHNYHDKKGWTAMGMVEVRTLAEELLPLIRKDADDVAAETTAKLFYKAPCMCWDNYFSGDLIDGKNIHVCFLTS